MSLCKLQELLIIFQSDARTNSPRAISTSHREIINSSAFKETHKVAASLFVYIRQSRGFVHLRRRACCFFRLRRSGLTRNRGNVPEIGSNEDSDAITTFVRTTDPLRASSIYWVYSYVFSLFLSFSLFFSLFLSSLSLMYIYTVNKSDTLILKPTKF